MSELRRLPVSRVATLGRDGLSPHAVRRAVARGDLIRLRYGVVVGAERLADARTEGRRHALEIAGCQARMPGCVASHGSAAVLHGLPMVGRPAGEPVHLTRSRGSGRRLPGAVVRMCALPDGDVVERYGVAVTSLARTVVDVARESGFLAGVATADAALRAGCDPAELEAVLRRCWDWRGIRAACRVVAFADGRAETALESLSRVRLHQACVPRPQLQVVLGDGAGEVGRVDFLWPGRRVIGEADGLSKYTDPQVLIREKLRQEALEDLGYRVVRWGWTDMWRDWRYTTARVQRALDLGGG